MSSDRAPSPASAIAGSPDRSQQQKRDDRDGQSDEDRQPEPFQDVAEHPGIRSRLHGRDYFQVISHKRTVSSGYAAKFKSLVAT